ALFEAPEPAERPDALRGQRSLEAGELALDLLEPDRDELRRCRPRAPRGREQRVDQAAEGRRDLLRDLGKMRRGRAAVEHLAAQPFALRRPRRRWDHAGEAFEQRRAERIEIARERRGGGRRDTQRIDVTHRATTYTRGPGGG